MFTKSDIVLPHNYDENKDENNKDNYESYNEILCNKNKCKPPSKILEDKIKFKNSIFDNVTFLEENKGNSIYDYQSGFILNSYFTNNMCVNNNCCILPCDNSNCITKNIFNIMILCCNLVYSLINQTRVSINDYFYSTDLIDELCFMYTLNNNKISLNEKILNILKQYYTIIFKLIINFSSETSNTKLDDYVRINLNFLNQNLSNFLNGKDITVNEFNTSEDKHLIILLNLFKTYYNSPFNNKKELNYFEKIQKITADDYINYFENAYNIIKVLLNNNFNDFYINVYLYNYNNNNYLSNLIKLRTYLLLMFIYKIRFISLNDVDDKGGRQAEFFISNVLRDFYNYYYIDNKFNNNYNTIIKIIYKDIILKELLQYNFYTKNYPLNDIEFLKELSQKYNTESRKDIQNFDLLNRFLNNNNIIPLIIYANNNIITLEYYDNNKLKERFIPFEKMYNINECSYNQVRNSNGKIGGDLIYLHECYTNNTLNSNSICIIVDSKAYQDSSYIFDYKIDKTIIQCYLYAQYVKKCYKDHIYNDNNNLYLCAVNPIYGSYYVYKYNDIENMCIIDLTKVENSPIPLNNYLNKNNYINNNNNSNINCTDDTKINNQCNADYDKIVIYTLPQKIQKEIEQNTEMKRKKINSYKKKIIKLLKEMKEMKEMKRKKGIKEKELIKINLIKQNIDYLNKLIGMNEIKKFLLKNNITEQDLEMNVEP